MLVSSIARFGAVNTANNMTSLQNGVNAGTFGGENNLSMLHNMDKHLSLDLASNPLRYRLVSLQEKFASKFQNNQIKKSLNFLA
jgi:hypothetical protein